MKTVIVTGGDNWTEKRVHQVLDNLHNGETIDRIVCGAGRGVDQFVFAWAMKNTVQACVYPTNWGKLGNTAFETRNHLMLSQHEPDLVVVFPGKARSANHLAKTAKDKGVQTLDIDE